jgi:hypothetical protein
MKRTMVRRFFGYICVGAGVSVFPVGIFFSKDAFAASAFTGAVLIHLGRRLLVRPANEALARDPRPPVVYLRPFTTDHGILKKTLYVLSNFGVFESDEEAIARLLKHIGPVVAIGRPGESLPTLGASRVYVGDSEWQAVVSDFLARASVVALRIGHTEGVAWEFAHVFRSVDPRKVFLYHPVESLWGRSRRRREGEYALFKERVEALLPTRFPPALGHCEIVTFDEDWNANPKLAQANTLWGYIRGWASGSQIPHLREGLRDFFQRLHIPMPPLSWAPIEYVTVPGIVAVLIAMLLLLSVLAGAGVVSVIGAYFLT